MRASALAALIAAACSAPGPGDRPAPAGRRTDPLVGPVTAFARRGDRVFACSQAGIAALDGGAGSAVSDPAFRVVGLAVDGVGLLACGGTPGEDGVVAQVVDGAVTVRARLADDLVSCVAVDADGAIVAGCDDGRVLELDPASLAVRAELRRHTAPVRALAFADGLLASAGLDGNLMLGVRDAAPAVLRDHTAGIECAAWSADGQVLASGSQDGRVRFHDRTGRLLASTEPLRARVLCVTADATGFVFGTDDGRVGTTAPDAETRSLGDASGLPVHALFVSGGQVLVGRSGVVEALALR